MTTEEDRRRSISEMWAKAQDDEAYRRLWGQFMAPELDNWGRYWLVELSYGESFVVDAGELADLAEANTIASCAYLGIGARVRLSASGYLDATSWGFVANGNDLGSWFDQELEQLGADEESESEE